MKKLYLKILELLAAVTELKFIEQDLAQLQQERPPVSFPCALIKINVSGTDDFDSLYQRKDLSFEITLVFKYFGESNSLAPVEQREKALEFHSVVEKVYRALQGYEDVDFEPFSLKTTSDVNLARGLKTIVHRFETSYREDIASS